MKVIVDINKKTLKMLENNRAVFKGEYGADKLELYINQQLENEYPVITALLSNGRRIGAFTTDDGYELVTIDGVEYTKANFTLSKENGFTLSEGQTQVTVWMYRTKDTVVVSKEAIGNITFTVVNTTAFNDGDIIISGDVEGTVVNLKVEMENLQSRLEYYLPLSGAKAMTGDLEMKGNNIIFDNDNEETIEIGEEDDEYSMSIRMEDSDYYKGRYRASGFSIGNDYIDATLDISESKFEMSLGDERVSLTPSAISATRGNKTSHYNYDGITRYDDGEQYTYQYPNKSGELALNKDIPTKTSQLENDSGYVVEGLLSRYMTRDTTQTVSGNKIFEKSIYFWNESTYIQKPMGVEALEFYISNNLALSIRKNRLNVYGTIGTESSYVSGIFGTNIKGKVIYQNNKQVANKEDIPTKLSQLENDTNYATQEDLNSSIEVAEGKTKTYVITTNDNGSFNVSTDDVVISISGNIITTDSTTVSLSDLKLGDIVLIKELDVPDRYVGVITDTDVTFYKMETSKVDLSGYATKTEVNTMIADYINSNFENGDEGSY